ncbi:hypothetical protein GIB67_036997 [Kingdonia uniflora]|uniref:Protein phosphatase n=1 Tax=Kingdonia uniflora TaxID=39325 RepID=A0A7J7LHR2_9MAGN|nr:hypothetical protein GIB67_036997 [Kingdonia uniflora]
MVRQGSVPQEIAPDSTHSYVSGEKNAKVLIVGLSYIPKDINARPRGEDAHFICIRGQAFGVANGVSGWVSEGVDAGEYARELMTHVVLAIEQQSTSCFDLKTILNDAYENTKAKG